MSTAAAGSPVLGPQDAPAEAGPAAPPEGHLPLGQRPRPGRSPARALWTGDRDDEPVPLPGERPRADDGTEHAAADLVPRRRLRGLDVARTLALVGMAAVHVFPEGRGEPPEPTWTTELLAGNAAAVFALLAGVTLTLLSGGRVPATGRRMARKRVTVAVRAVLLILLGLTLNELPFPAFDILPYYGLMFLLALPLLHLRTGSLLVYAAGFALLGPFMRYVAFAAGAQETAVDPSLSAVAAAPFSGLVTLFATGVYPAVVWMAYVCLGMAVGRARLDTAQVQARMVLGGVTLTLLTTIGSWLALTPLGGRAVILTFTPGLTQELLTRTQTFGGSGELTAATPVWQAVRGPHLETVASTLHAAGIACAAVGLVLLLQGLLGGRVGAVIAGPGAMSLTLYTGHLLLLLLPGWADHPWLAWIGMVALFLVAAALWRRVRAQGPLETLVSWLSRRVGILAVPPRG